MAFGKVTWKTDDETNLAYSDNPEVVEFQKGDKDTLLHTAALNNTTKNFEWYHMIKNSNYPTAKTGRFYFIAKNKTNHAITIRVKGAGYFGKPTSSQPKAGLCADTMIRALNSGWSSMSVPAYSVTAIYTGVINFAQGSDEQYFTYGRYAVESPETGIELRTVAVNKGPRTDAEMKKAAYDLSTLAPADGTGQFTGELEYSAKYKVFTSAPVPFRIGEHPKDQNNVDEYTPVVWYKSGGATYNKGNFGVVYRMTFPSSVKSVNLKFPRTTSGASVKGCVIYKSGAGAWKSTGVHNSGDSVPISLDSQKTLRVMITGANNGNYEISV